MLISINEKSEVPIYMQIVRQIKGQIQSGLLKEGDELPSVRELSGSLGINMHTVHSAYRELRDWGIITMRLGRRARVAGLPEKSGMEAARADFSARVNFITDELRALIVDARLCGISADDFRRLVEHELETLENKRS